MSLGTFPFGANLLGSMSRNMGALKIIIALATALALCLIATASLVFADNNNANNSNNAPTTSGGGGQDGGSAGGNNGNNPPNTATNN